MPELLAPAGDFECLEAALRFGADAVYLAGQRFGMRGAPKNFGTEELRRAIALAHSVGKRVYVACNNIHHPEEMRTLPAWLESLHEMQADAVIVSDLGSMKLAQTYAPSCEIHISTQAGVTNAETAAALYELGAQRVILARELTLDEIVAIRCNTPAALSIECFVHGSMCVSYSGRCLLSNYLTGRDANGGQCTQPCRWSYALMEETRPGEFFPVYEDGFTHIMHSKDMCLLAHLPKLLRAGIVSLKIEGRAKAAYYVATVTNAYRTALDSIERGEEIPAWVLEEPYKVSHREYCTGFYFDAPNQAAHISAKGGYIRPWEVIGVVESWAEGRCMAVQRGRAFAGERLEALSPGRTPVQLLLNDLRDESGQPLDATRHPEMRFSFACDEMIDPGTILRAEILNSH